MLQKIWHAILRLLGHKKPEPPRAQPRPQPQPAQSTPVVNVPTNSSVPPLVKPRPPEPPLYSGRAFQIDEKKIQEAWMYLKGKDGDREGPTLSQQGVVFSEDVATTVLAGAGSGKSTTLVSRVLFLHKVLKVPFNNMAVFTFTRKSRKDFVKKLVKESEHWEVSLSKKAAQRIVRTFHSKALGLIRSTLRDDEQIFEFLGKSAQAHDEEGNDEIMKAELFISPDEDLSELEIQGNETDTYEDLTDDSDQAEILRAAYIRRYNSDPKFQDAIHKLLAFTLASKPWEKDSKYQEKIRLLRKMSESDETLCEYVEDQWQTRNCWPIDGIDTVNSEGKRYEVRVEGMRFFVNGYVPKLGVHVVLGPTPGIPAEKIEWNGKTLMPAQALSNKKRMLLAGCGQPIRFINDAEDMDFFLQQLNELNSELGLGAPIRKLKFPGEFKPHPVFKLLYAYGSFAEALALKPNLLSSQLQNKGLSPIEMQAIYAISAYFETFYDLLDERGLVTFNQVFARLGKGTPELERLGVPELIGIKHLMIDEFQDIAPLIVNFVLGVQGELKRKSEGRQQPTLICVGDDWQSIYGWRGSSPHFLLELKKHFPGAPSEAIQMNENFRSSQRIINNGEAYILHVAVKSNKTGIAKNKEVANLPFPTAFIDEFESKDILRHAKKILVNAGPKEELHILAHRNDDLEPFKELAKRDSRVTITSFHQSKGLEADYVLLIGAPKIFGTNNIKNAFYALAKFPQTFDDAQRDEAFRVAYVAATRAKKLCIWYAQGDQSSVVASVTADGVNRQDMLCHEIDALITAYFCQAQQRATGT